MFTGIVRAVGTIERIEVRGGDRRLAIRSKDLPWPDYKAGESIAVNGVCLTAVELDEGGFAADVSVATMERTTLGDLTERQPVNLEPSLSVGERLGGHFVSGHVDCVATVSGRADDARSIRLTIELARKYGEYRRYLAEKGSVCVDGVSLTVNEVSNTSFDVNIIPHTANSTIVGRYKRGTRVNIEVDLMARYLESLCRGDRDRGDISREFLRANGFLRAHGL